MTDLSNATLFLRGFFHSSNLQIWDRFKAPTQPVRWLGDLLAGRPELADSIRLHVSVSKHNESAPSCSVATVTCGQLSRLKLSNTVWLY